MSKLSFSLIACIVVAQASADYRPVRETCSGFELDIAKLPRFDTSQYRNRHFQSVLVLDRRPDDLPQEPKLVFRVLKGDVFEINEVGKIRGTEICAFFAFEATGKRNRFDPCHSLNVTQPLQVEFGDVLYIAKDRNTLIFTFCKKKENGICTDGLIDVTTQERRPSAKRLADIAWYLQRIGLLDEFGITKSGLNIQDVSRNDCDFPPTLQRLIGNSNKRSHKPRKHYRY